MPSSPTHRAGIRTSRTSAASSSISHPAIPGTPAPPVDPQPGRQPGPRRCLVAAALANAEVTNHQPARSPKPRSWRSKRPSRPASGSPTAPRSAAPAKRGQHACRARGPVGQRRQLRSLLAGIADCPEEGVACQGVGAKVLDRTPQTGRSRGRAKTLVESLSRPVAAEREAYNIGSATPSSPTPSASSCAGCRPKSRARRGRSTSRPMSHLPANEEQLAMCLADPDVAAGEPVLHPGQSRPSPAWMRRPRRHPKRCCSA